MLLAPFSLKTKFEPTRLSLIVVALGRAVKLMRLVRALRVPVLITSWFGAKLLPSESVSVTLMPTVSLRRFKVLGPSVLLNVIGKGYGKLGPTSTLLATVNVTESLPPLPLMITPPINDSGVLTEVIPSSRLIWAVLLDCWR